jgi:hypothetical protein
MTATVPPAFWEELKHQGLIAAEAPLFRMPELV